MDAIKLLRRLDFGRSWILTGQYAHPLLLTPCSSADGRLLSCSRDPSDNLRALPAQSRPLLVRIIAGTCMQCLHA
jgi:hypothetical protein